MFRNQTYVGVMACMVCATAVHAAHPELKFQKFNSVLGRLIVEMPGEPTVTKKKHEDTAYTSLAVVIEQDHKEIMLFQVDYLDFQATRRTLEDPRGSMKAFRAGLRRGQTIIDEKQVTLGKDNVPGFDYLVKVDDHWARELLFQHKNRLYRLVVAGDKDDVTSKDADRFFDSFEITK